MITSDYISQLPRSLKQLVSIFLLILSVGYFSGLAFVNDTTSATNQGIIVNYNGNEDNEEAEEMKFKKSYHEMLNIIHTHILSMSIIFFILGGLVYGTNIHPIVKSFLMIEPLLSVLVTFGGIYLIWLDVDWMSYVVMISGGLMTLSFMGSILAISSSLITREHH